MPANTDPAGTPKDNKDAAENALAREQEVAPGELPVKQHNPGNQGLNPGQKGPAQPAGNS